MKDGVHVNRWGTEKWYVNNQLHREDGPAIEWSSGSKEWFRNGLRHREDGPAVIRADGTKMWYRNGECHREDGPAIEYSNGDKGWYLNGREYSFEEWLNKLDATDEERLLLKLTWT